MLSWKECEFYMGQYQLSSCVNLADMYCVSYLFKKTHKETHKQNPLPPLSQHANLQNKKFTS